MLIHIGNDTEIDTDRDLSSEERHVLQKLLCYTAFVDSLEEFRERKEKAYAVGWNNSGPIRESRSLKQVVEHLEKELDLRLKNDDSQTL